MKLSVQIWQGLELKCLHEAEAFKRATHFTEKLYRNQTDHPYQEVTWNLVCLNLEKKEPLEIYKDLLALS